MYSSIAWNVVTTTHSCPGVARTRHRIRKDLWDLWNIVPVQWLFSFLWGVNWCSTKLSWRVVFFGVRLSSQSSQRAFLLGVTMNQHCHQLRLDFYSLNDGTDVDRSIWTGLERGPIWLRTQFQPPRFLLRESKFYCLFRVFYPISWFFWNKNGLNTF